MGFKLLFQEPREENDSSGVNGLIAEYCGGTEHSGVETTKGPVLAPEGIILVRGGGG
jgi:hypothetical protein